MSDLEQPCSICGKPLAERHAGINDAWPIADGKCCDACNSAVVIPARIELEKSALRQLKEESCP